MDNKLYYNILLGLFISLFVSCTSTKYVPENKYLLDKVEIISDNPIIKSGDLSLFLRQNPNSKWFNLFRTQLYIYNLSGPDSTKWANQVLRRLGDKPVIYNAADAEISRQEMMKAVKNMGYIGAFVDTLTKANNKKIKVTYKVSTGLPYRINHLRYQIDNDSIWSYIVRDSAASLVRVGNVLDINVLDKERQRITTNMQRYGFYRFNKDYISFTADTVRNTYSVDLTIKLNSTIFSPNFPPLRKYGIKSIHVLSDINTLQPDQIVDQDVDSIHYKGIKIFYKGKIHLQPKILYDNIFLKSGELYNIDNVQKTYLSFSRLPVLRYTNLRFIEHSSDSTSLDAYVLLTRNRQKSISFEVEGTNNAGDLGMAVSTTYRNRNLFKGSESFMLRLRGAYEAVSGLQGEYKNESYTELNAETSISFPRFLFPFLSSDLKRNIRATTEFGLQYNYQLRPEFTRNVASISWNYKWQSRNQHYRHQIDLIDLDYLYMPWIDSNFKQTYLDQPDNYILRYNYDDRLIMRSGYGFVYNSAGHLVRNNVLSDNSYTVRFSIESAGNLLYGIAKTFNIKKQNNGEYDVLSIPFAQYISGNIDYSRNIVIDERNSLAYHIGGGIAIPYGNADVVPFEKRFFSGGANSVRGWSVRSLGPGTFVGDGNFMNQSGDIKLDASIELRSMMFWKLSGAAFIDAGNIWTLKKYDIQPGGQFLLDKFYQQIAVSYGIGFRLDLDFFILRFDFGMKAVNPAFTGKDHYPIIHPKVSRDLAFHFAVGYPF